MPPKSDAKRAGAGASPSASRASSPSPEQEPVPDDSTMGGHPSSSRGRLTHGEAAAGRRRQSPGSRSRSRSRSASTGATGARGKTAATGSKTSAQSASQRTRASLPRLAGPSNLRSSHPSTVEKREDTGASWSGRKGTRRRSFSAKPDVAARKSRVSSEDYISSAADESKRSRKSTADKQKETGASSSGRQGTRRMSSSAKPSSGRQGTRRMSSSAKPAVARKSRGSFEDRRQSRASSLRSGSGSRRISRAARERAKSSAAAAAPSRRYGELEMFELDDEDEEATGSRPSSSHSKRGDRSSGAIRRAKFSPNPGRV